MLNALPAFHASSIIGAGLTDMYKIIQHKLATKYQNQFT